MANELKYPECGSEKLSFDENKSNYTCKKCNLKFKNDNKFKPLRIFISYGHDIHAVVAEKLRDDLIDVGHKVWFDRDRLKPGGDWEQYIEEGLDWVTENPTIGRIILLMTPHSVRRPKGYCLNELRRFLDKSSIDPIPIMLVWCEPPLSICRLQWLDMQECIPLEESESEYNNKFIELLESLQDSKVKKGSHNSLKNALQPLDFDIDILSHIERFIGRDWIFEKIDEWIKHPNTSRIFWIIGEPGTGKTAIASWLCEENRRAAAFHLCQHDHDMKSDPRRCLMSIAYQLSTQIPEYHEKLKSMNLSEITNEMNVSTIFRELITKPLFKIPEPDDAPLIILIDALDEASDKGKNELAKFISKYFNETPEWLRLIITSRPEPEVKGPLQKLEPYKIDTDLPENFKDIRKFLKRELKPYLKDYEAEILVVDKIINKSEGNFLYVEWIRRELEEGNLSIENIDEFPQGLGSIYFDFFDWKFPDIDYYEEKIAPALDIISASQEPLELGFLSSIMEWTPREKHKFERKTASLFSIKNDKIQPFHKSLMDWLTNPGKAGDYYISEENGHKKLAEKGWKNYKEGVQNLTPYMLSYIPYHLIKSNLWNEIEEILTDLNYIERKCKAGIAYKLIKDYNQTLEALPEAQEEKQKKLEYEKRVNKYVEDLITYAKGEVENLEIIPSVELWSKEKINEYTEQIINNSTNLDKIKAFSQFLNSQIQGLIEFGHLNGFCIQQAQNFADSGPVAESVNKIMSEDQTGKMVLRDDNWLPEYNPCPTLIKTLEGHDSIVESVTITANGKTTISGHRDGTVRVWDLETGENIKTLKGHTLEVNTVAITPDGKTAVTGSKDGTICVWDLKTGKQIQKLEGYMNLARAVAITPDGKKAITGSSGNGAIFWDLETGKQIQKLEGHKGWVYDVAITPDGKKAISGSEDKTVRVWDLNTGKQIQKLEGYSRTVRSVSITPDGKKAITGSEDNNIHVWDLEIGKQLKVLEEQGNMGLIVEMLATHDGKKAITGSSDKIIRVWDLETGKQLKTLKGHTNTARALSITPDGKRAISGSYDNTIRVWDLETGKQAQKIEGHTSTVRSVTITPDGKKAVTGSGDKTVRVWDLKTGKQIQKLEGHIKLVRTVAVTPDGRKAVTGSRDGTIRVWDLKTGKQILRIEGHRSWVSVITIIPDGKKAITGSSGNTVRVWDLETGKHLQTLEGHKGWIYDMVTTPDGKKAISGSGDKTVRVWDLETGKQIQKLEGYTKIRTVAVTPDGKKIISGSNGKTVRVWDLETGKQITKLQGHTSKVRTVVVTPDGKKIISGSEDKTVRVWNLETEREICVYKEKDEINSLATNANRNFVYGNGSGDVVFNHLVNISMDFPLITATRIWLSGENRNSGSWEDTIKANCEFCGKRFKVQEDTLNVIKELDEKHKKPNGWIADEAWKDPRLISECPYCNEKLKFNPFIVDNKK